MSGRWVCSKQREKEMYLLDWKRGMRNAHFIIQAFHRNKEY